MKTYTALFEYSGQMSEFAGELFPARMDWWQAVVEPLAAGCDGVRLTLSLGDTEGLFSAARLGARGAAEVSIEKGKETWTGRLDGAFRNELLSNPLDGAGRVKWAQAQLYKAGRTVLSIERHGTTFLAQGLPREGLDDLTDTLRGEPFSLYVFAEDGSGVEVELLPVYRKNADLDAALDVEAEGKGAG